MLKRIALPAALCAALGACSDSSEPGEIGPPADLVVLTPAASLTALANTDLPQQVQISVRDANGRGVANQTVTFGVIAGGGSLGPGTTAISDANGTVTAPTWRLGKSAVKQTMRAQLGSIIEDVDAEVTTAYDIVVRFWGASMTNEQQALFTNAAARLSAIVTGDIANANAQNIDLAQACDVTGQPPLNEIIDDVIIYASIQSIDGPGRVLAQAGPCLFRATATGSQTAVGVMSFDSADLGTLSGAGSLQDVITHEMFHVLGIGVFWEDRAIITGAGTIDPRYTGNFGRQGCVAVGGSVTCAQSVPVENTGGEGTADAHWRETTFDTELMTGFIDGGALPISALTIGGLRDLGLTVNSVAADSYTIPAGLATSSNLASSDASREKWETILQPRGLIQANGRALMRKQ